MSATQCVSISIVCGARKGADCGTKHGRVYQSWQVCLTPSKSMKVCHVFELVKEVDDAIFQVTKSMSTMVLKYSANVATHR